MSESSRFTNPSHVPIKGFYLDDPVKREVVFPDEKALTKWVLAHRRTYIEIEYGSRLGMLRCAWQCVRWAFARKLPATRAPWDGRLGYTWLTYTWQHSADDQA